MFEMLKTLAISVDSTVGQQDLLSQQAAKDKILWIVLLCVFLAIEIFAAVLLPKLMKKYNKRKEEKALKKAERKRIQSKR